MITLKEYADQLGISYEAVRRKVKRYRDELGNHLIKQGRTQYLDDDAVEILEAHRKDNVISIIDGSKSLTALQEENKALLLRIAQLQDEIISRDTAIQQLQADKVKLLEEAKPLSFWQRIFHK